MADADKSFASCCTGLKDALSGGDGEDGFEPLIAVGDDDILYMSIGLVEIENGEPGMMEHPVFFCPFCGTKLQTPEDVDAKAAASTAGAES